MDQLDRTLIARRTTNRPLVIVAVMLSMFMIAIEATIVSTAMPRIIGQLGGLQIYAWVFSAFLLTQTLATVVFGKLSDIFGRGPTILAGIVIFLLGSILCGFAWSMPSLIAFRLVQGIGAGAIQPIALTVIGDLYSAEERGRVQGFVASVWAVSSVLGPLVGAFIVEHFSWAWIFWMNLPFGILAALGYALFLHETERKAHPSIDWSGLGLVSVALTALMLALTGSGDGHPAITAGAALIAVVAGAAFFWVERRATDPVVSLAMWSRRPIAAANASTLLAGMALIGLTTFLPIYMQGVLGRSPVVAGLALTVMVLGWPLGATIGARSFGRIGLRPILLGGGLLIPVGAIAFLFLSPATPAWVAGAGSFVMGLGMGFLNTAAIVLIQEIVPWSERGSATASNVFSRNLGSTLGAAVLGAVLNHGLARGGSAVTSDELQAVLQAGGGAALAASRLVLELALDQTFWAVFVVSLLTALTAWLVPEVPLGRNAGSTVRLEPGH